MDLLNKAAARRGISRNWYVGEGQNLSVALKKRKTLVLLFFGESYFRLGRKFGFLVYIRINQT